MTNSNHAVKKVVIAGGGTAGWIAAAALSHQFRDLVEIVLVESEDIGTVGVGEASIPPMKSFHNFLNINEQEFMRATEATFKLGIGFQNWARPGDNYIHAFGITGQATWVCEFHHFWMRGLELGVKAELGAYCPEFQAAKAGKFAITSQSQLNYAYHLDAGLYAKYLRKFSEARGTKRIEGKIKSVEQDSESGFIKSLSMESGQVVEGDLFVDCTGFRGLLIEQTLKTGYEDWTHWLPCNSAIAIQTESVEPPVPYTLSIAGEAGWRWRIPLQHRVGNGLVYCDKFISDDSAMQTLLSGIKGTPITKPRVIKFTTGRRRLMWNKNCVALGLASGFVEPLESTSIHLIMMGVTRLIQLFPFAGISQTFVDQYNTLAMIELEKIRDFIVLHYNATEREDTSFWQYCKHMQIPDTLAHRMQMFSEAGHAFQAENELFRLDSWIQVMFGQRLMPKNYHHFAKAMKDTDLIRF
ncbi:MAG TPA: tryptophan halogenase family protein, partial [Steroidobacteraceae bacterium]|nr:tryptophan halogenase family protein [Steroidobacteraceae bacterium]